ncbi:hypothetical protein NDU88_003740 [Pleurodeles waltl]|uniref:Uncharacterized protein n=1 Tax=Pleurodeles waltl TaxID=8319 RepID=A0AAV7PHR3_PLEWA|nr:hypothetical protein NDU88_003740 [Pleurodeles waltl]
MEEKWLKIAYTLRGGALTSFHVKEVRLLSTYNKTGSDLMQNLKDGMEPVRTLSALCSVNYRIRTGLPLRHR